MRGLSGTESETKYIQGQNGEQDHRWTKEDTEHFQGLGMTQGGIRGQINWVRMDPEILDRCGNLRVESRATKERHK